MTSAISSMLHDLAARIALWRARAAQRRALSQLDDNALADIGLTRDAARGEALRPFWQGRENAPASAAGRPTWPGQCSFVQVTEARSGAGAPLENRRSGSSYSAAAVSASAAPPCAS